MGRVLLASLADPELNAFLARAVLTRYTPFTITEKTELRAALEKIRRSGYALVDQELEVDLRSVAVPVQNAAGRVIAAMNVSAQASRRPKKQLIDVFLPALRGAAIKLRPLLM